LARYLHETLSFPLERAADLSGLFGGLVWFLAIFGGAMPTGWDSGARFPWRTFILAAVVFPAGFAGSAMALRRCAARAVWCWCNCV